MVAKIPFHGKFVVPGDLADTPARGTVTITPSNEVRDPAGNVILTMVPRVYELDANGEVSGALYATDDVTVPSGWTYTVKETLLHPGSTVKPAYQRTWTLIVPKATVGTLELADVADAQPVQAYQEFATWTDLQTVAQSAADETAQVLTVASRPGYRGTGMVSVASGTNTNPAETSQWLTYGSQMARLKHVATTDLIAIRLVYWNGINSSNDAVNEIPNPNQISVRASVEVGSGGLAPYRFTSNSPAYSAATAYVVGDQVTSGGTEWVCIQAVTGQAPAAGSAFWQQITLYPIHFPGESATRDVTLQGGQIVVSEPIHLSPGISKGQVFYTRTYVQPNNGTANTGNFPRTWYGYAASGFYSRHTSSGAAGVDLTLSPPTATSDADNTAAFGPIAVIGIPKDATKSVVFILGDSFVFGTGETTALFGDEFPGYLLRLLTDNPANPTRYDYGFIRSGKGSQTSFVVGGVGFSVRLGLAMSCTHVVDGLIVNDIGTGKTLAQIQAAALLRWNALAAAGLKVFAVTSTPRTTSPDNWATTANQTPAANFGANSKWSQYNDWVRTVPAPLAGVIDAAAAVTDVSGLVWTPGYVYTGDGLGLHPSTAGNIQIASQSPLYLASDPTHPVTINAVTMFGAP